MMSGLLAANNYGQSKSYGNVTDNCCPSDPCPKPCPKPCPPEPCPPCPPEPCCVPNPCCPKLPAYGCDVPCNFAILWEAGPRVCDGTDFFITVDFIWWTAREDGLGYAMTGVNNTSDMNGGKGSVQHPDWEWDPGFKVGAGFNVGHDGWDIYAQYTWLHFEGSKDRTSDPTGVVNDTNDLVGMWAISGNSIGGVPLVSANGRWDLHFNAVDVELGRNYFVSQYLTVRPFIGFKGTWQHQDYKVRYASNELTNSVRNVDRMRQDHDMWGIGIRSGFNFAYHFVRDFSIFGDIALTALMTKFDIDRKDRTEEFELNNGVVGNRILSITTLNTENDFYSLKGVLELDIGLRWDVWFGCNDTFHFRLQAAWEEQLWWSQNNMIGRFEECAHGDLMLHGLTIKARFDF